MFDDKSFETGVSEILDNSKHFQTSLGVAFFRVSNLLNRIWLPVGDFNLCIY